MSRAVDVSRKSLASFIGLLTALLVFALFIRTPAAADLWWHLRAGQTMWLENRILLTDPFSYTRLDMPWVNAFWMSEILLYLLYSFGGAFALAAFVSIVGAATFYLIYRRMAGNPFVNSLVILLAAITAAPIWGPRPQLLSFLLIAMLDYWLSRAPRTKWVLIPLFALWANLHGGWIWGFLLLIAHIAGIVTKLVLAIPGEKDDLWQEAKSLLGWTALASLSVGVNPNGIAIWKLPFAQVDVSMQILEWLSPDFHRLDFHPLLWMIFLLLLTAPFATRSVNWSQIFKVVGFAYLTFVSQRNIAIFAIVAAPLLSDWANAFLHTFQKQGPIAARPGFAPNVVKLLNILILSSVSLAALGYLFSVSRQSEVEANYPSGAMQWIKDNRPEGRLFNSYNWGGYILWHLPEYPVFIDGRADLYGDEIISDWQMIVSGTDEGLNLLDSWNIQLVFIETDRPLVGYLEMRGWKIFYRDDMATILGR